MYVCLVDDRTIENGARNFLAYVYLCVCIYWMIGYWMYIYNIVCEKRIIKLFVADSPNCIAEEPKYFKVDFSTQICIMPC